MEFVIRLSFLELSPSAKFQVCSTLPSDAGFPNRSVFYGKGPDPDFFDLQGPENGPDFTEKSGFLS